ncbi:MAG: SWIM zinc finger domain-containing protein [Bifidobacteriaceae bacterium]|jgi:hypothetical protein|nr:SWIM zinc finger domain-containing protein [Bifidobacteriaceae bacterium]
MVRSFVGESALEGDQLGLALAPALTPEGVAPSPCFFKGFAAFPAVVARGLAALAEVTATRYFQYRPEVSRDPVLSAQGDRLRAECFSACNGVYARLDLLEAGFDGGEIGFGTTNVDVNLGLRQALARVRRDQLLRLEVGSDGLEVSSLDETVRERPVAMPDRWVRALGNAAQAHCGLERVVELDQARARSFVASLPAATGKDQSGWLTPSPAGARLAARRTGGAVFVAGLRRLSALKRLLTNLEELTFYQAADSEPGPVLVEAALPAARLTLGLTAEAWRGFSGEGALLVSLAAPTALEDARLVGVLLAFEPVIDVARLARKAGIGPERARAALAVLAASGRVGWDAHDSAYFHRELPDDPDRVTRDNPRLAAARGLVEAVEAAGGGQWLVRSGGGDYQVSFDPAGGVSAARCTCAWYLKHPTGRGPCKHVLAVQLKESA